MSANTETQNLLLKEEVGLVLFTVLFTVWHAAGRSMELQ